LNVSVLCDDGRALDSDNDIRLIGTHLDALDKLAKKRKLTPLMPYFVETDDPDALGEIEFLDPAPAIATLEGPAAVLEETPAVGRQLPDVEDVLEEIPWLLELLRKAAKKKKRVRLICA
jgi:hypothetical protein